MSWLAMLQNAVEQHPRGIAGVADEMDISRTAISLAINGKYPAKTDKIEARVLHTYARVACPHLSETITIHTCRSHSERAAPTNSPREMRHWRACQNCPHKTTEEKRHAA